MLSTCGYYFYTLYDEFPEEAQLDNLRARYPSLVASLVRAIEVSESTDSLAAQLERIDYPPETLSVALRNDSEDELSIIDRFAPRNKRDANSSMRAMVNGSGYGHKNHQHFFILQHPLKQYEYDYIEVLIERPKTEEE